MLSHIQIRRRIMFWASFGSALEYYDFVVYAMMVKYLSTVFFTTDHPTVATIQFYLIFAVGYFARPLGGLISGMIGDTFGRRSAFLLLTSLMAGSTLSIGALPGFQDIGMFAPLLLATCRILQGISFGGELPGAAIIVGEFNPRKTQGFGSSLIIASTSLGALGASLILFGLSSFLNENQIIAWGWRVPFLVGGGLGMLLFFGRWSLEETPVFKSSLAQTRKTNPLILLFQKHARFVFQGFFLTTFFAAMVLVNLYYPYYLSEFFGYDAKEIYFALLIGLVFSAISVPLAGLLSDKIGQQALATWACTVYAFSVFPLFYLVSLKTNIALILFLSMHQLFIALFAGAYFPMMIVLFPTRIRYTGFSVCYNMMFALMALLPSALTHGIEVLNSPWLVPLILALFAMISLVTAKSIAWGRTSEG